MDETAKQEIRILIHSAQIFDKNTNNKYDPSEWKRIASSIEEAMKSRNKNEITSGITRMKLYNKTCRFDSFINNACIVHLNSEFKRLSVIMDLNCRGKLFF